MKTCIAIVLLVLAAPAPLLAQSLRYLGRPSGSGQPSGSASGWIELGERGHVDVRAGAHIPGWGRVRDVLEDRIVIEQHRTEAEKEDLERKGALPYDVLEIHIMRDDLRGGAGSSAPRHD